MTSQTDRGIFRLEMLPACEGDCLLLTWGEPGDLHRLLIDGGRKQTYSAFRKRFLNLPEDQRGFDLLVITHIDRDHIEGAVELLEDPARPARFEDIWFNGYDHLLGRKVQPLESFGPLHGERVTSALLSHRLPWNKAFGGGPVEIDGATPVTKALAGGLEITVLSPTRDKLAILAPAWLERCREEGLMPGVAARPEVGRTGFESFGPVDIKKLAKTPFHKDSAGPNGTSIALLAQYKDRRILLAADAHADLLEESLSSLVSSEDGRYRLDAMKVAHHGSSHNTSDTLLNRISCPKFLISTNGALFHHPDPVAMARLIRFGGAEKEILFNYHTDETALWKNSEWQETYAYRTHYPNQAENGNMIVDL